MMLLEALQSGIVALLVGYLSLTNALAERIESQFSIPAEIEDSSALVESVTEPSEELVSLSRLYAETNGVARVLRESVTFQEALTDQQEAAVIEADDSITADSVAEALVNILCRYSTEEYTRTTTGTGFFIGTNGVILTNAHVAQFLLLEGKDARVEKAECIVRSGNPATPRYHAELLFISPSWILNNAELITEEFPRGTGEYDYALLYVSDSVDDTPLPQSYPALPFHTDFLPKGLIGTEVLTAGYPAEKLLRDGIRAELEPEVAVTKVSDMYTFGSNYADIFSVSDSVVGEQGASGGPVVHPEVGAIGLIVTKGDAQTDGARSLRALTLSYIHRTILEETGFSLETNTAGNLSKRGEVFKETLAPFLLKLLTFEMDI